MKDLSPDNWKKIDTILEAVLDRDPDERPAYLKEVCGSDESLYNNINTLLRLHIEADRILGESATTWAAPLIPGLIDEFDRNREQDMPAGTRLGPYEIKSVAGRGGMGTVYRAVRADETHHREVALKIVRRGMDTTDVLRRFRYEQQILASLDHPEIARLYDAGVTGDGRPYFVMEYVDGLPIDQYCDKNRLSVRQRIGLFRSVCSAVSYAHQNLVVHRDLKPSNILVTTEGKIKLLDFGIAKLLDDSGDDPLIPLTRTGAHVLTPRYAAPEQLAGGQVTTATDVFTLGVVLYELLAGIPPFERRGVRNGSYADEEFTLPSRKIANADDNQTIAECRATQPDPLQKILTGDLDNILLKSMHRDTGQRYSSPGELSEDLKRYMVGLPVTARPFSRRYLAGKFIGRHKTGVTLAVVVTLLLIVFTAGLVYLQSQTRAALHNAELERETAEEISAFLESLLAAPNPMASNPNRLDTMRVSQLLERAEERIYSEFIANPEIRARMLVVLGRSYRGLGNTERATEMFENALGIYRTSEISNDEEMAKALSMLATVYMDSGKNDNAEELLREVQTLYGLIYTGDHHRVASNLSNIASSLQNQGKFAEARQLYDQALAMMQRMHIPDSLQYADLLNANTALAYRMNDLNTAISLTKESIAINRAMLGDEHPRIGRELNNLAFLLDRSGNLDEALPLYHEVLALNQRLLHETHPFVIASMGNLADALSRSGEPTQGEGYFESALELHRLSGRSENPELSVMLGNYASMLSQTGRLDEAEQFYRNALDIDRRLFGEGHIRTGIVMGRIGGLLCRSQRLEEGIQYIDSALSVLRGHFQDDHPRIIDVLNARQNCTVPG
ncbi:MAG: hypothetical protein EA364_04300 [Balneolaceae bacterium]|nr:MAG: hypothetical protein EA364_04300 [Balneolaceae bacterium]